MAGLESPPFAESDTEISFNHLETASGDCKGLVPNTPVQVCFALTHTTQLELVTSLTPVQVDRELSNLQFLFGDSPLAQTIDMSADLKTKTDTLQKLFTYDHNKLRAELHRPITHTAHAPLPISELTELKTVISCTLKKLEGLNTAATARHGDRELLTSIAETFDSVKSAGYDTPAPLKPPAGQTYIPCTRLEHDMTQFSLEELDQSTDWTHTFGNRQASFYSDTHEYKYTNTHHKKRKFSDNPYLALILAHFRKVYPWLRFNSALLHKNITLLSPLQLG